MGKASELMTALSFMQKGMPLIYSGQEYDLDHRLKFFEKDSIPKTKGKAWELLQKLGQLKNTNPALHGGKNAASYNRLDSEDDVLIFERSKGNDTLIFIGNFSNKSKLVPIPKGVFEDGLSSVRIKYTNKPISLKPFEYKILIRQ
jgi:glycosidase